MECNKDEALRAKSIAEDKLEKKDFVGARKFALKAQTLYPGLDGISQMLTTVDVYVSAENKISGEVDWYGVLGVNPSADDETVRKQYRKLALALHPDKNKSVGAEGAFKLLSEAWSLLSDTAKRLAYNQRRGYRGVHQKIPMHTAAPPAPFRANGSHKFGSRTTTAPKTQNKSQKVSPTQTPVASKRTDTFWTICHQCKIHYEFVKEYLNSTLLCPTCKRAFIARETSPPSNFISSKNQVPSQQQVPRNHMPSRNAQNPGRNVPAAAQKLRPGQSGPNSVRYANYQQVPLSGTASVGSTDPFLAAKAANVVQQAQDKLKRAYTESNSSTVWDEFMKKRKLDDDSSGHTINFSTAHGNGGFGRPSMDAPGSRIYGFSGTHHARNSIRDLAPLETRNMLMLKARKEISAWRSERNSKAAGKEKDIAMHSKTEKLKSSSIVQRHETDDLSAAGTADQLEKGQNNSSADNSDKEADESMNVPDPDFHDFDSDRTESSFGDNEVWAAYDDDDGMPRFYALISKVISRKPFKLRISWLNSKSNSEFSTLDWVGKGFYKTCGEFRVGRYETCKSINAFSQKVNSSRNSRGSVIILPQKDDVWAVYKNWSSNWNEDTPDDIIHKYDMVMVLEDYSEEKGIFVAPLTKVVSFKTVFRANLDPEVTKWLPKEEMFRFSHRVPYHLLTGQEAQNAPKGCLELDPAATPLELLQVISEPIKDPTIADEASDSSNQDDGNIDSQATSMSETSVKAQGENS